MTKFDKNIVLGRRLNHGGHGKDAEVNLLGNEGPPSLQERHSKLQ